MQRTRLLIVLGSFPAFAALAAAEPAPPAPLKAATPVEAKRAAPVPPTPEQKGAAKTADNGKSKKNAKDKTPKILARDVFGKAKTAADLTPRSIGWYAKGCLAGGVHLADAGPEWQTMRPSRNRAWGHPKLIALLKRLGAEAKQDGWPGLLVGDISQPRGGPMVTGHASHQVGLDADVWLTPMPDHVLSIKERENIQATSMLDKTSLSVDPKVFTPAHVALIKRAALYPSVERIFVHPAIKKALCQAAGKDRAWLGKVRPLWGHYYHFHIRIGCPNGGCEHQPAVSGDDGCGKELTSWLKTIEASLKPKPKPKPEVAEKYVPPSERRRIMLDQLPAECKVVLNSPGVPPPADEAMAATPAATTKK